VRELIASVENFEPQVSSETKAIGEELETTSTQQEITKLDKLVWFEFIKHQLNRINCTPVFFNTIEVLTRPNNLTVKLAKMKR